MLAALRWWLARRGAGAAQRTPCTKALGLNLQMQGLARLGDTLRSDDQNNQASIMNRSNMLTMAGAATAVALIAVVLLVLRGIQPGALGTSLGLLAWFVAPYIAMAVLWSFCKTSTLKISLAVLSMVVAVLGSATIYMMTRQVGDGLDAMVALFVPALQLVALLVFGVPLLLALGRADQ